MTPESAQAASATHYIRRRWSERPRVGIILGTGLGGLVEDVHIQTEIPYEDIPGFNRPTSTGHRGKLVCGHMDSVPLVVMQGRLHLYEGYPAQHAARPVRVMRQLGIDILIVSNASGGVNPQFASGDVVILEDHINLTWQNPLIGINDDNLGPRFPDMSSPYDAALRGLALGAGRAAGFACHLGVYAAMSGPTYETRAEYRMLRKLGADIVGMSTVPETIAAIHSGLRVLGLSAVTNLCRPDRLESTSGRLVQLAAEKAAPKIRHIVKEIVTGQEEYAAVP